jgi:hypothetical protein
MCDKRAFTEALLSDHFNQRSSSIFAILGKLRLFCTISVNVCLCTTRFVTICYLLRSRVWAFAKLVCYAFGNKRS